MEITVIRDVIIIKSFSTVSLTKKNDWDEDPEVGHCQVVGHQGNCSLRQALLSVQMIRIQGKL